MNTSTVPLHFESLEHAHAALPGIIRTLPPGAQHSVRVLCEALISTALRELESVDITKLEPRDLTGEPGNGGPATPQQYQQQLRDALGLSFLAGASLDDDAQELYMPLIILVAKSFGLTRKTMQAEVRAAQTRYTSS